MEKIELYKLEFSIRQHVERIKVKFNEATQNYLNENHDADYLKVKKWQDRNCKRAIMEFLLSQRVLTETPEHTKKCKKCMGTGRIGYRPVKQTEKDPETGKVMTRLNGKGKPLYTNYPILCECLIDMIEL